MSLLGSRIRDYLKNLPQDQRRIFPPYQPLDAVGGLYEGKAVIQFASNDYLGLSHHPQVKAESQRWLDQYGVSWGASRLVSGQAQECEQVEKRLAQFKGTPSALVLNSGFQANIGVLEALLSGRLHGRIHRSGVKVFADRLNHASLFLALKAAGVPWVRFRHHDMDHLAKLLEREQDPHVAPVIVTESVFSMEGDRLDVAALDDVAAKFGAFIYVDEAHATGVLGPQGQGLCGQISSPHVIMGTFGKGLGAYGAYVAGCDELISYLIQTCQGLIYTTALPPPSWGAISGALKVIPSLDKPREHLQKMSHELRQFLRAHGGDVGASSTQIVPLILGHNQKVLDGGMFLRQRGFWVGTIRPPTVAQGQGRLRITLSAAHDDVHLQGLCQALKDMFKHLGEE